MLFHKAISPVAVSASLFCGFRVRRDRKIYAVANVDYLKEIFWCSWVFDEFFGGFSSAKVYNNKYIRLTSSRRVRVEFNNDWTTNYARWVFAVSRSLMRPERPGAFRIAYTAGSGTELKSPPWFDANLLSTVDRHDGRDHIAYVSPEARKDAIAWVRRAVSDGYAPLDFSRKDVFNG